VVYGANKGLDRRRMMQELLFIKSTIGCIPWLIVGDFNVIRFQQEKWGFCSITCYEKEFMECISKLEIEDLAYTRCFHTWTNKQSGVDFVSRKLDKVMSNN
jgi:hypothetical protein